jgi:preprotein translocase subunit SecG
MEEPSGFTNWGVTKSVSDSSTESLDSGIEALRQKVERLEKSSEADEGFKAEIKEIAQALKRLKEQSEELTARFQLPSNKNVPLVRFDLVQQFEQHRSDANIAFLILGIFGGAIFGILNNWATSPDFVITRFSIVLVIIFFIIAAGCGIWAFVLHRRATLIWKRMIEESKS